MKNGIRRGLVFAIALVGSGCGLNPTVHEAVAEIGSAYCSKLDSCHHEAFKAAYPGGVDDCVERMQAATAADADKMSACSDSEIDLCTQDIGNMSCDASLDASKMPTSCQKC